MSVSVPALRVHAKSEAPVRHERRYVLYWMIAYRRTNWNFSLDRAIAWASELHRPLVIFEPLSCTYPWASDRHHQFIIDGMRDNARALAGSPVVYFPYVEPRARAGRGLLEALASRACVVVTDDYPGFFLPKMVGAVAERLDVRLEAVDSNGLLPVAAASRVFARAASFRRHLQRTLPEHFETFPSQKPFQKTRIPQLKALPAEIRQRWPDHKGQLSSLPIDHSVLPTGTHGGMISARKRLHLFISDRLERYSSEHNHPENAATSGLSAYLHFGHISPHEIFTAVAQHEACREWWKMSDSAEAFLDQLVTWRELGFNFAAHRSDYAEYSSLPLWAQATLAKHSMDHRAYTYSLRRFEEARTHDPVWNAAQRQLTREGRIHNYMRMLWGKKILEWSPSPERALEIMIHLNNKYALDGRDPNSYSGIFWVLGRYDRPWGPERPVFGKIRYMSSENAKPKLHLKRYLETYGPKSGVGPLQKA